MSNLPAGVYTAYTLATDGRSVVLADSGAQFGNYERPWTQESASSFMLSEVSMSSLGTSVLPAGVYAAHTMTTDGRSIVFADTGEQFGAFYPIFRIVLGFEFTGTFVATAQPLAEVRAGVTPAEFTATAHPIAGYEGREGFRPGPVYFEATASPTATVFGHIRTGTFECTAHPTASFDGPIIGVFVATAHPTAQVFVRAGQLETCFVGPETPPATRPPNYAF